MSDLVCPSGHRVPMESVEFVGTESRPQCPVCKALGVTTSDAGWTRPPAQAAPAAAPSPAPYRPLPVGTRRWPKVLAGLAGWALVVGVVLVVWRSNLHNECGSFFGQFAQGSSSAVQRSCLEVGAEWLGGWVLIVAGIVGVICSVIGFSTDPGRR